MEKHQRIAVAGFLYRDGETLIMRRADSESFLPGFWDIPGGKSEFGETPQDALVREFLEETGLKISVGNPFHAFSFFTHEGVRQVVDIIFLVSQEESGDVVVSEEHSAYAWISADEIDDYQITPETKECLRRGFAEMESFQ